MTSLKGRCKQMKRLNKLYIKKNTHKHTHLFHMEVHAKCQPNMLNYRREQGSQLCLLYYYYYYNTTMLAL